MRVISRLGGTDSEGFAKRRLSVPEGMERFAHESSFGLTTILSIYLLLLAVCY